MLNLTLSVFQASAEHFFLTHSEFLYFKLILIHILCPHFNISHKIILFWLPMAFFFFFSANILMSAYLSEKCLLFKILLLTFVCKRTENNMSQVLTNVRNLMCLAWPRNALSNKNIFHHSIYTFIFGIAQPIFLKGLSQLFHCTGYLWGSLTTSPYAFCKLPSHGSMVTTRKPNLQNMSLFHLTPPRPHCGLANPSHCLRPPCLGSLPKPQYPPLWFLNFLTSRCQ